MTHSETDSHILFGWLLLACVRAGGPGTAHYRELGEKRVCGTHPFEQRQEQSPPTRRRRQDTAANQPTCQLAAIAPRTACARAAAARAAHAAAGRTPCDTHTRAGRDAGYARPGAAPERGLRPAVCPLPQRGITVAWWRLAPSCRLRAGCTPCPWAAAPPRPPLFPCVHVRRRPAGDLPAASAAHPSTCTRPCVLSTSPAIASSLSPRPSTPPPRTILHPHTTTHIRAFCTRCRTSLQPWLCR